MRFQSENYVFKFLWRGLGRVGGASAIPNHVLNKYVSHGLMREARWPNGRIKRAGLRIGLELSPGSLRFVSYRVC